jgi:hypothetical protein
MLKIDRWAAPTLSPERLCQSGAFKGPDSGGQIQKNIYSEFDPESFSETH